MLHVSGNGRVDPERLGRTVRLVSSTSPSSLLLASLDSARRQLAVHGQELLGRTLEAAARAREAIDAIEGCHVVGEELVDHPGVAAWDPLRIVIDVRDTGCTGYEVADALRRGSDVHVELATHATIVLVLGIRQPVTALDRFAHDLAVELELIRRPGAASAILAARRRHAPRRRRGAARGLPRRRGEAGGGRRRGPGVGRGDRRLPARHPRAAAGRAHHRRGRRVSPRAVPAGARLHGASDPEFGTITVLVG